MSLAATLAPLTLPDADGKPVRLGDLWAKQPAVIVFLRHWGWIFCREHVAQLRDAKSKFDAKGANIAAIGLGGADYARHFRDDTGVTFPLLVDETSAVHRAAGLGKANLFHIFRRDNRAARLRARLEGLRQYKLGKDPFQLGGSFIFGPGDHDRFAHLSQTSGDNAPMHTLLAALD